MCVAMRVANDGRLVIVVFLDIMWYFYHFSRYKRLMKVNSYGITNPADLVPSYLNSRLKVVNVNGIPCRPRPIALVVFREAH